MAELIGGYKRTKLCGEFRNFDIDSLPDEILLMDGWCIDKILLLKYTT